MSQPKVIKPRKLPAKKPASSSLAKPPLTNATPQALPSDVIPEAGAIAAEAEAVASKRAAKPKAKLAAKPVAAQPKRRAKTAKFAVGTVVRHRVYPFRGVVFDIDPVFDNTEEWWLAIPEELRPKKNQPFYHLLAENDQTEYIAYVSEQNLLPDASGAPLRHPKVAELFVKGPDGRYRATYFQPH